MTNPDDILNLYKELYQKEFEKKEHITSSLNIQISLITGFLTIQFYLITTFDFSKINFVAILFILVSLITLIISIISIYYLILVYSNATKGYSSTGFPTAKEIEKYRLQLIEYYKKDDIVCKEFKSYLIDAYIEHYDSSLAINDKKTKFLFSSKKYSIIGLILVTFSSLFYLINFFTKEDEIKKIKIDNLNLIETKLNGIIQKIDSSLILKNKFKIDTLNIENYGKPRTK